jgi:GTPase
MAKRVPIVAIVGRANVGKSSLFNLLIGSREAIVADEPGTTRDSITGKVQLESGKDFWLVDTAGLKTAEDDFELTIQEQIIEAAASADIILVMVEAGGAISEEDRRVAKLALKSKKEVILLANKADRAKNSDIEHFARLGISRRIATSITQRMGIDELEEILDELLPTATIKEEDNRIRVALLGRPNVGKSSLFNSLAKKQQAVVADRAGTTRDVNRTVVRYSGREIELLDTAGIRRSGKIERGVEHFSVLRSLRAIEEADVCFLLIDANEHSVALDQKIAGLVKEAGKGLALVISKWDIKEKDAYTRDQMAPQIMHDFVFVPWAPLVFTSSETGKNVSKLFDLVLEIMDRRAIRIKTAELNKWLKTVTDRHPPAGLKNRQPKLRYMVQEDDNPIPAFKIFGSQTKFLHWSYKRHMERMLRETWDYAGTPVQLWFIDRDEPKETKFKNNGNRDSRKKYA